LTYEDWLLAAATGWIDWDNNPPPREMITEELCLDALHGNMPGFELKKIPVELRSAEVCWAAFYNDDDALPFIPEKLREELLARKDAITEKQWLDTLSWYDEPGNYYYIKLTKKLLTPEFCLAMVKLNGNTLELVPQELRTPELAAAAHLEVCRKI